MTDEQGGKIKSSPPTPSITVHETEDVRPDKERSTTQSSTLSGHSSTDLKAEHSKHEPDDSLFVPESSGAMKQGMSKNDDIHPFASAAQVKVSSENYKHGSGLT